VSAAEEFDTRKSFLTPRTACGHFWDEVDRREDDHFECEN